MRYTRTLGCSATGVMEPNSGGSSVLGKFKNGNGAIGPQGERAKAYEAKLAIVEYFEAVAADPSKFDRHKLRALNVIWPTVPSPGFRTPDLSERLKAARVKIRAARERPAARA